MNVIFLNSTTRLVAKVMAAADHQLKFTAHYYESSQTNIEEAINVGVLNDTAWVEIVAAATVRRGVKEVTFYNPSDSSQGLVLGIDVSGTITEFLGVTIDAGSYFTLSSYEVSVAGATGEAGIDGYYKGKRWIPAFALLPDNPNPSGYYLEGKNPATVFSHTVDESMKIILSADEIPESTTGIKFRVEARHDNDASPASRDVRWSMAAGWYNGNWEPTAGTEVAVVQTLDADDDKTAISSQSGTVTINGTQGTDDKMYIEISRTATEVADTLASAAFLTRVELEFLTT